MNSRRFFKYWLPALIWMSVIFLGSTNVLSEPNTSRFIVPFLHWLNPHISFEAVDMINMACRKFGHVSEYAILAALLWRALRAETHWHARLSILFAATLLACAAFAAGDEFHQSFVPTRTPSLRDVLIDIGGALVALMICAIFAQRKSGPERI
ncbi:MAG TPA: VanZ family protein [Chthoniobacterales bacterium]|nr:VanZ family protein [Chthoniobacterales bacterium]